VPGAALGAGVAGGADCASGCVFAVFDAGAVTSPQALTYLLSPLVCILLLTLGIVLVLGAVDEWFNPRLREA